MGLASLVPMAFVASVARSIAFYEKLGFAVGNTHRIEGAHEPTWVWLRSSGAQLMLARTSEPVDPAAQAVLFYVYCDDVQEMRNQLLEAGVEAGPVAYPFYAPKGEFRVTDPDGYALMVTHT